MKVEISPTITMDNMRTILTLAISSRFQTSAMTIGVGTDIIARSFLKIITVVQILSLFLEVLRKVSKIKSRMSS